MMTRGLSGRAITRVPSDPHVTVYMGQRWERCQVGGHFYVIRDKLGMPLRKMTAEDRQIVVAGKYRACGSEYWIMGGNCEKPGCVDNPGRRWETL